MPYISQRFIDDLPNQIDIVDLISKRISLKKTGSDYRAPCPFHGGKNRNLAVNSHKQFYHCFKCGESGGAISFVQKFDNLSFVEAVEVIAGEFGLAIEYDKNSKPVDPKLERFRILSQKVNEFYQQQLRHSPAKNKVVQYAKKRGLSGEIAKRFELGFAPPSNQDLLTFFEKDEASVADLKSLGLIKTGEYGDYDFFRDRLMFPIHNTKGQVIAFGGRAFDKKAKAKYLNSQESPIFSKSKELYGLYHARKYSRSMDYILVVEGYMDVVALHQVGITKSVATLGTATTAEHLQILSRNTNTIVFCFDGDDAGRVAAWKALKIALPIIKSGLVFKFLFLPDGEDPDTLVKKESAKEFKSRIQQACTLSNFLFDHIKAQVAFDTIEGKTIFLEKAIKLIAKIHYDVFQSQLLEGLSQIVGQSADQVQSLFAKQISQQSSAAPMPVAPTTFDDGDFPPAVEIDEHEYPPQESPQPKKPSAIKALMSRMINLLLNYPDIADSTVEHRVRQIPNSEVLLELIHSAQIDEQPSQQDLIKPFRKRIGIYQRLQQLCLLEPYLDEKQARKEFLSALVSVENRFTSEQLQSQILSASTIEDQKKVMAGIQKNKRKQ